VQSRWAASIGDRPVTVRVTTLKGLAAGKYYVDKKGAGYYLEPGEPAGIWLGRGAAESGLVGEVDDDTFLNLMDGNDPTGMIVRGRHYSDGSVRGYDITFSAPKSTSVLWAVGDADVRADVEASHDAAVRAVVDFVDRQSTTRQMQGGQVVCVDTRGLTVAAFRQHTSRAGDPQLHTHAVVIAKVQAPDGKWLALDGRPIKCDQRTLSSVYHAALRGELTSRLGVEWRSPVNGIAEMASIDSDVLLEFSKRTVQVEDRQEVKLERFQRSLSRTPTPRERYQLEREAVVDSRPSKPSAEPPSVAHARWRAELRELGIEPAELVTGCVSVPTPAVPEGPGITAIIDQALAALTEQQSTWRRNELVREIARAFPTTTTLPAAGLTRWIDSLADHVAGTDLLIEYAPHAELGTPTRDADGRPITESPLDRRFTTPAIVAEEGRIIDSLERRLARGGVHASVDVEGLDRAQLEVANAVAGTKQLVLIVGPAGTGKTTALRPAVQALQSTGRNVVGLAPSATAAGVLAVETGMRADTVDKLLHVARTGRHPLPPAGTTVIVDEASMLATPKLADLVEVADRQSWRIVLVGDPLQLSAVGRGGMFAFLASVHPPTELETVHRFTHDWEREATLELRLGHTDVLDSYDQHHRLHDVTTARIDETVTARWWILRRTGSTAVLCATNETARRLNARMQAARLAAGELTGPGLRLPSGEQLYVGDVVATRRNDRAARTDRGAMVKNRVTWIVTSIGDDGSLTVSGTDGTITLQPEYVGRHVELAYAETIHAAQGRTVDRSILVVDGPIDGHGVYVGMTRGRESNEALVITEPGATARDTLADALSRSWLDRPAVEVERDLERQDLTARLDRLQNRPALSRDAPGLSL
jgi:conjugative relaxase-like TrwC/TraI family protein